MGLVLIELKRGDRVAAEKVRSVQLYKFFSRYKQGTHMSFRAEVRVFIWSYGL